MKPILSTEEVTTLENIIEREGTSKAELMEHAGEFVAQLAQTYHPHEVVVLVGFGNNGGDGWVAADILQQRGVHVVVVTPVEPNEIQSALARHVARRTAGRDVTVVVGPSRDELAALLVKADLAIDAIFGTGFHGSVRAPFSIWIPTLNEAQVRVISVDIPSGLNAVTGVVEDCCVRADKTATMIAPKIGLYSADGPQYVGELVCGELYDRLDEVIGDVDHAAEIVEAADLFDFMDPLPANVNKYSRGSVLVVGGSARYPGAAIMAAKAAARAGAGYVSVAAPDACANLIRMALPSVPVISVPSDSRGSFGAAARSVVCDVAAKYDCVLCGPGMTTAAGCMQVTSGLLELDVPLVLDADALNCLSRLAIGGIDKTPELYRRDAPLILTPHHKELSRLIGDDQVAAVHPVIVLRVRRRRQKHLLDGLCRDDGRVVEDRCRLVHALAADERQRPADFVRGHSDMSCDRVRTSVLVLRDALCLFTRIFCHFRSALLYFLAPVVLPPAWPLKVLVGANSPSLQPTMSSVI